MPTNCPPPPFWYNTLVLPPYPALVDSQRSCHSFSSPFGTSFHFVLSLTVVQIQRDILKKSSGPLLRTLLVGECQHTKLAKIVIKCGISCALSATVLCPLVCRCTLRRPPLVKWSAMQASVARTLLFLGCVCACAWSVVSFFFVFSYGQQRSVQVCQESGFTSCGRPCTFMCSMAVLSPECQRTGVSDRSKC